MQLEMFVCDAFTRDQFAGNSAAVVPVTEWPSEHIMQNIAIENNLSETAFAKKLADNHYFIRWFSPLCEIDFCGHATLATSYVLFSQLGVSGTITYSTESVGELTVTQNDAGRIVMDFPNKMPSEVNTIPAMLLEGLSITPSEILANDQAYVAVLSSEQQVLDMVTDSEKLKQLYPLDVVVTAKASNADYDFVSRYFWPANGGDEDPVTGSIHAGLAPFWAKRLGKHSLVARQASKRGGTLYCEVQPAANGESNLGRVTIAGDAVLYSKAQIFV